MTYTPGQGRPSSLQTQDLASILRDLRLSQTASETQKPLGICAPLSTAVCKARSINYKSVLKTVAGIGIALAGLAEADYFIHNVFSPSFVVLSVLPATLYGSYPFVRSLCRGARFKAFLNGSTAMIRALRARPLRVLGNIVLLTALGLTAATVTQNALHPLPTQKPRMLRMMERTPAAPAQAASSLVRAHVTPPLATPPQSKAPKAPLPSPPAPPPPSSAARPATTTLQALSVPMMDALPPSPPERHDVTGQNLTREQYMTPRPFVPN